MAQRFPRLQMQTVEELLSGQRVEEAIDFAVTFLSHTFRWQPDPLRNGLTASSPAATHETLAQSNRATGWLLPRLAA